MKYPIASKRQVCNTKKNWYLTSELVSVTSVVPMRGVRKKVFAWRITKCLDLENAIQALSLIHIFHSQEDLDMAIAASNILFGKATKEKLAQLDEATLNDVFANVYVYKRQVWQNRLVSM